MRHNRSHHATRAIAICGLQLGALACDDTGAMSAEPTGADASHTPSDASADFDDNCPGIANPDQVNLDGDTEGDACDACPAEPSEPGLPCPMGA